VLIYFLRVSINPGVLKNKNSDDVMDEFMCVLVMRQNYRSKLGVKNKALKMVILTIYF